MNAAEPFEPPTADVAQAYLAEAGEIERRREARVDRRMLGWLHMVDGLVVGVLFSAALVVIRSSSPTQNLWPLIVVVLVIWMDLSGGVRDRWGVRPRLFRSWSVPYLLVFVPTMLITMTPSLVAQPWIVLVPFALSVLVFGVLASRQWRSARRQSVPGAVQATEPFTRGAAIATAVFGVFLGVLVFAAAGVMEPMTGLTVTSVVMVGLFAFMIASQIASGMPVLGRIWTRPQWSALVIGAGMFLTALVLGAGAQTVTLSAAVLMGAAVVVLFMTVAVWGVRRSTTNDPYDAGVERGI